jgi:hypothetical protein
MNTSKTSIGKESQPSCLGAVMCSSFQEIFYMLDRGISVFENGYLHTLGQMEREGLINVRLDLDGTALVSRNCT